MSKPAQPGEEDKTSAGNENHPSATAGSECGKTANVAEAGQYRNACSRLIKVAAAILTGRKFLSPYADDHPKTTPKWVLKAAEGQREQLRLWAIEIREVADYLSDAAKADQSTTLQQSSGPTPLRSSESPERCPTCGRRARSDFDQDSGKWFECEECNHQWSYQSSPPTPSEGVSDVEAADWAIECADWIVRGQISAVAKLPLVECLQLMVMPIARIITRAARPRVAQLEAEQAKHCDARASGKCKHCGGPCKLSVSVVAAKEEQPTPSPSGLEVCPFCGDQAELKHWPERDEGWEYEIVCQSQDCEVYPSVNARTREAAVSAWNSRTPARASQWEDKKSYPDEVHGCSLTAHDTGDGWALCVEDPNHDVIAYLDWPETWPEEQSTADLVSKGFKIV